MTVTPHSATPHCASQSAVSGLIDTAALARPMSEVAHLVSLLNAVPGTRRSAEQALRTATVQRPLDDVTSLVQLLSGPSHDPGTAAEAVRLAAVNRPVADVPRLISLLSNTPHRSGTADQAVRAAAVTRPLEDLVQLIGLLEAVAPDAGPEQPPPDIPPSPPLRTGSSAPVRPPDDRPPDGCPRTALRLSAAVALAGCGAAHLPGGVMRLHPALSAGQLVPLAAAVLCLVLACGLLAGAALPVRVAAAGLTAGLGVAHLLAYVHVHAPVFAHGAAPPAAQTAVALLSAVLAGALLVAPSR
jgi:hypothetical protein